MKKTALTFGLLAGGIIIVYSFIVFLIFGDFSQITPEKFATMEVLGYLRYLILILTVIFAIRHFKKQNGGEGTFKQLFMAGFNTVLIIAVLVGLMECIYMLANPGFMDQYADIMVKSMEQKGASAAMIAKTKSEMDSMKWMANPAMMGIFYFFETAVIGTIVSVITALIQKPKKKQAAFA